MEEKMTAGNQKETLFTLTDTTGDHLREANAVAENIFRKLNNTMKGMGLEEDKPKEESYPKEGPLPTRVRHNLHSSLVIIGTLQNIYEILIENFGE
jgi:hypothetical protein